MGVYEIKLPDVGEGVAEAELVEWMVEIGTNIREDEVLASVMTDKATVEIPSPVEGKVVWRGAEIGDNVAVGAPVIRIEIDGEGNVSADAPSTNETPAPTISESESASSAQIEQDPIAARYGTQAAQNDAPTKESAPVADIAASAKPTESSTEPSAEPSYVTGSVIDLASAAATLAADKDPSIDLESHGIFDVDEQLYERQRDQGMSALGGQAPLAAPAVRRRASDAGIDLQHVHGTGPEGRITHEDLESFLASGGRGSISRSLKRNTDVDEIPMIGLRRKIADKMVLSKSRIPHITYVDEIDLTALEELRTQLNANKKPDAPKLTILPFLMRAMVRAIEDQPQFNARFDDDAGVIHQHGGVHIGIAAQTKGGLMVPVVRHAEARTLHECAVEMTRLAAAAKEGTAKREELTGSTITITSLGPMGGIVTTPVINHPEVAIIGINKIQTLPRWDGAGFVPRKIMNLSSSFDHRVVDGWNAAVFIQRIKTLLEAPALLLVND